MTAFWSVFVTVTFALGTTAPLLSVTVPAIVAVTFWAIPTPANTRRQQKSTAMFLFNCISPPKKLHLPGWRRGTSFLKKNALLKRFANFLGTENISATKRRKGSKCVWA